MSEKMNQSKRFGIIALIVIISVVLNAIGTYLIVMNVEYSKVGGKANYDVLNKMQLQQVQSFIEQYKQQGDGQGNIKADTNTQVKQDDTAKAPTSELTKDQIASLKKDEFVLGKADAKMTVIEYSDLECPYCKRLFTSNALQNLLAENKDTANYMYKHFPLDFHKNAQKEAEAIECAWNLGGKEAYFRMKDYIFTNTTSNGEGFALADLPKAAKELKLDEKAFQTCLDSGKFREKVLSDQSLGNTLFGINGTPGTVIINNETGKFEMVSGAQGQSAFEAAYKALAQ